MKSTIRTTRALALVVALAGCSNDSNGSGDAGTQGGDGSSCSGAVACVGGALGCDPDGSYGTSMGSNFRPLDLTTCDGTPFSFYGADYCEHRYTILVMSAGWCVPCQMEAAQIEDQIVSVYADRGVRVVSALIQDENFARPDAEFCQQWTDAYDLTIPVLLDPDQKTGIYFPAGSLPANLIVDENGVIVHREYGTSVGLNTIKAALDRLLAGGA